MKYGYILLSILLTVFSQVSGASCGPPECCAHPHRCGKGPETEKFYGPEAVCLKKAAMSVDGKIVVNSQGYPYSILDDYQKEAARVIWANDICVVKYNRGYHR
jgi:hypothetical protein